MKILLSTFAASAILLSAAAHAERYGEEKALCAKAISAEAGRAIDGANVQLKKMRDRAVKRLTVLVSYPDGESVTGECHIRKGEVESVTLEA